MAHGFGKGRIQGANGSETSHAAVGAGSASPGRGFLGCVALCQKSVAGPGGASAGFRHAPDIREIPFEHGGHHARGGKNVRATVNNKARTKSKASTGLIRKAKCKRKVSIAIIPKITNVWMIYFMNIRR